MFKKILMTTILGALLSTQAFAQGYVHTVTIQQVRVDNDGRGIIFFSMSLAGGATCGQGGNYKNALAFNASTVAGQQILQLALHARDAQGYTTLVDATGTGACNVYGSAVEDIWNLILH